MIWSIVFVFIVGLLFSIYSKIRHITLRNNSKKISAVVVEYRREKAPIRNDYSRLNYPYVRIETEQDCKIVKLRFADSFSKPFEIGEQIFVFWNGNDLLYWDAYEKGLYQYLPKSWKIFK